MAVETVLDLRLAGGGDRGFGMAAGSGDRRVWDWWKLGFFLILELLSSLSLIVV